MFRCRTKNILLQTGVRPCLIIETYNLGKLKQCRKKQRSCTNKNIVKNCTTGKDYIVLLVKVSVSPLSYPLAKGITTNNLQFNKILWNIKTEIHTSVLIQGDGFKAWSPHVIPSRLWASKGGRTLWICYSLTTIKFQRKTVCGTVWMRRFQDWKFNGLMFNSNSNSVLWYKRNLSLIFSEIDIKLSD